MLQVYIRIHCHQASFVLSIVSLQLLDTSQYLNYLIYCLIVLLLAFKLNLCHWIKLSLLLMFCCCFSSSLPPPQTLPLLLLIIIIFIAYNIYPARFYLLLLSRNLTIPHLLAMQFYPNHQQPVYVAVHDVPCLALFRVRMPSFGGAIRSPCTWMSCSRLSLLFNACCSNLHNAIVL